MATNLNPLSSNFLSSKPTTYSTGQTNLNPISSGFLSPSKTTQAPAGTITNAAPNTTQQPSSGGNTGGGGGGNAAPSAPSLEDQLRSDVEAIFSPIQQYLSGAESTIKGDFPSVQGDINKQFDASAQSLTAEKNAGQASIDQSEVGAGNRKTDALNSARNLFNELMTGGQQRFGGASSAGEAFAALGGRELQKNVQTIGTNFETAMQQISSAKSALAERFSASMANLNAQKDQALNDARREYEARLQEINRLKAEAESNKAQLRLQALQDLRNKAATISAGASNLYQSLTAQKTQADSTLSSAVDNIKKTLVPQAQAAGNTFNQSTTTNPETALNVNDGGATNLNPISAGFLGKGQGQRNPDDLLNPLSSNFLY